MGFDVEVSISALTVFLQGIFSFFSPCVLPLVPLYIGYLSGGAKTVDEKGVIRYRRGKVMVNTVGFVLGVSFAFFLLGFGFTAAGQFFSKNQALFTRIGGILIILFGLYQLGVFGSSRFLSTERRLPFRLDRMTMSPLTALVLGFTFSFAWTPCVGPALASVLLMASSASSAGKGFLLIALYTLGFVLPFLAVGLFTGTLLDFFKKHQKVVRYTVKAGGVLMILMGVMMFTGWLNSISSYLSKVTASAPETSQSQQQDASGAETDQEEETEQPQEDREEQSADPNAVQAPDFALTDQYGEVHTLADYEGKTIFLNFWATWCGPCRSEMPDIQALYEDWEENTGDVVVLGVASPTSDENPYGQDGTQEEITAFLEENGYTYPVLMDTTGKLFSQYGITAFPTTFMIASDGTVFGYVTGAVDRSIMDSIVEQTMTGKRAQ